MGSMSFLQDNFLGGEWSKTASGRVTDKEYRISMSTCLNYIPVEPGAVVRKPGTIHGGYTRGGVAGRLVSFAFEEAVPYNIEFTSGYARFWSNGNQLVTDENGPQAIQSIAASGNPAVVTTTLAMPSDWVSGNSFFFGGLGAGATILQNRVFVGTVLSGTTLSIADSITGATIDAATITGFTSGTISKVQELVTPYLGNQWDVPYLRSVQTENTSFLLNGNFPPYALNVAAEPTTSVPAQFDLTQVTFNDGPYLDPLTNGAQLTANALSGIVSLSLSFPLWSSTAVYTVGDFVTSGSANYESLVDQNLGYTPSSNPTQWEPVTAAAAINNGQGFTQSDVGRLIRLYSEPQLWSTSSSYAIGAVVSYNPTGQPGAATYWQALTNQVPPGAVPGTDLTNWELVSTDQVSQWTWGNITAPVSNLSPSMGTPAGNMTQNGGIAAAFNGETDQSVANSATLGQTFPNPTSNFNATIQSEIGLVLGTASKIASVTIWPTLDAGISKTVLSCSGHGQPFSLFLAAELLGSHTGIGVNAVNLGQQTIGSFSTTITGGANNIEGTSPVTIVSNNVNTAYKYIWVSLSLQVTCRDVLAGAQMSLQTAQVQFTLSTPGVTNNGITVEILGPALLYNTTIRTWRLGLYSNTTGFPKCGTYSDGRIWLSGAVPNRIDACMADGINDDGSLEFAPTDEYGTVGEANGISYIFNAPDANAIFWMEPDQQGILCGTQAGEWLVTAPTTGGLSPLNISARRVTKVRCANVEPRRGEHTIVFVQAYGRKLIEYFPDVFSGKFTAPNLAEKWKHLTVSGIVEIAYQQELAPIVWLRLANGNLVGATYKRDTLMTSQGPTFIGAHRFVPGSGNLVTSICVGPSESGVVDALSLVTQDQNTGYYHVELLTDLWDEGDTLVGSWFLDNAIMPSSYSEVSGSQGLNLNGLWHLNGYTCTAFINGIDCGDWPVNNGTMFVPFFPINGQTNSLFTQAFYTANPVLTAAVGYTFTSQGALQSPDNPDQGGSRMGTAFGKKKRQANYKVHLVDTQGISFGMSFNPAYAKRMRPALLKTSGGGSLLPANVLFNGVHWDTLADDTQDRLSLLGWQQTRPFPGTIATISGTIETADE